MGTNPSPAKWYGPVRDACFGADEKIPDSVFLKIFAAIMCIPKNSNYGKATDDRKSGKASLSNQRRPKDVRADQEELLRSCVQALDAWTPPDGTLKQRLENLGDELVNASNLDKEKDFVKKNSSYKAPYYLSLYLDIPDYDAQLLLRKITTFYADTLTKVFAGMEDRMAQQLVQMKQLCRELAPDWEPTTAASAGEEMGSLLCVLLLLTAAKNCKSLQCQDLPCTLLGIIPPEPGSTLSIIPMGNVTLKANQFILLCHAALRADLDLVELQFIYRLLNDMRKKVDYRDPEARRLVESFIRAVDAFGKKTKAELDKKDWDYSGDETAHMDTARYLIAECRKWIT